MSCRYAPGQECDRLHTERPGKPVVFALDVDDPGLAPEDALAEDICLDQAGLRPADDPDHDGVGAGQLASVQLPGVVAERSSVDVTPEVDAASAEPALGDEWIGGLDVRGGGAVPGLALDVQRRPRQSGSV